MTLPEVLLWNLLRKNPAGIHFRRQHPIGPFIVDFFCAAAKMVVEIDGIAHDMGDRPDRDCSRDAQLAAQGITVMRIPATEVLACPELVAEALVRQCSS